MTEAVSGERQRRLVFNMALAGPGPLSGPMHYARHVFEAMLELVEEQRGIELIGLVSRGGERHFSPRARAQLRYLPTLSNRITRVFFEQTLLPIRLLSERADLLFNPAFTGPLWGAPRIVTTVPDVYFRVVPDMVGDFQRRYLSLMVPLCCRRSRKVLTISQRTADDLVSFYPDLAPRTFVTHLGSKFSPPKERRDHFARRSDAYVLLVANLTHNKNPEVVINAVAKVRSSGKAVRVVHVGQDHYGLLANAIARRDAGAWVSLKQGISDEELRSLYETALCLVIPSYYEGFGMPALEGQSAGTPLLCSTGGALPEVAGEGALYFEPDDTDQLASHIEELLGRPELRAELIKRGYANTARFDWSKTAQETLAHFLDALEDRGAARGPSHSPAG